MIAVGPYSELSRTVPVAVRNNTARTITNIQVQGTAHSASGALIAVGADQEFSPYTVKRGEIAFGYVFFNGDPLPTGATFRFNAGHDISGTGNGGGDLVVSSSRLAGSRIIGIARNNQHAKVEHPIEANAMCFTRTGRVLDNVSENLSDDVIAPGRSRPFQIELHDPCPVFLVAVGGFLR